jgi:maltose alpha-D-glucosyltransferase/alpha-amylase
MTPVEMLGDTRFPVIGRAPYFLSLGPHGFYWFRLKGRVPRPVRYGIEESAI